MKEIIKIVKKKKENFHALLSVGWCALYEFNCGNAVRRLTGMVRGDLSF
ncbi:MAG TPA: hypothetical protein VG962_12535 [Steroidobacteraceae bacterium]|nr:hypothetical protein [Steroidobacteraceae bacterium]